MTNKVGTCNICGAVQKLTNEDVVPIWLRKEFANRNVLPGDQPPKTLLPICYDCNHGLANALEGPVSRIVKNMMKPESSFSISLHEQELLAKWILKTDALRQIWRIRIGKRPVDDQVKPYAKLAEDLIAGGTLPEGCSAQIVRRDDRMIAGRTNGLVALLHPSADGYLHSVSRYPSFATVSCIGLDRTSFDAHVQGSQHDSRVLIIWPLRKDSLAWPPKAGIAEETLSAVLAAGSHSSASMLGGPYLSAIGGDGQALVRSQFGRGFRASTT
ncbi:hypothetical protein NB037_05505 [Rathayibacter sp. ZW T2_19]|uniref:HNH endonuclease n=1 Tax=Rathayibacter rubneri TaxID=2950106 RepID=A0A9X2DW75_9MICO|nr:hypothetical protein [Rathayibacter rubneri]MCM6761872.1 hypothetical protein [Rathayibacter rubneri]